jgi:hypothetical protein
MPEVLQVAGLMPNRLHWCFPFNTHFFPLVPLVSMYGMRNGCRDVPGLGHLCRALHFVAKFFLTHKTRLYILFPSQKRSFYQSNLALWVVGNSNYHFSYRKLTLCGTIGMTKGRILAYWHALTDLSSTGYFAKVVTIACLLIE